MAEKTTIPWCDHSFNVAWGCIHVSPGCAFCYAFDWDARFGGSHWGDGVPRKLFGKKHWNEPRKWNRKAESEGRRHRVFCSSMTDIFLDDDEIKGELPKLWALIRETPWLTWLLLTKRPERAAESLPSDWGDGYPNAHVGVSIENQAYADIRLPVLAKIPSAIRFVSYEPALGPVDFTEHFKSPNRPDQVIVGGESGDNARPFDVSWARYTVQQCREYGVAPFVKQLGARPFALIRGDDGSVAKTRISFKDKKGENWDEWGSRFDCIKIREFPEPAIASNADHAFHLETQ